MKTIKINIIFFLSILFLSSCEKEIDFKGKITDPLIVINSIISPDSAITAYISKSKFFLANDNTFDNIENAEVSVFVNGTLKEKMKYVANGLYKATYIPNASDNIQLRATAGGFKDVICNTVITPKPNVISMDTSIESLSYWPMIEYKTDKYGNEISRDTTSVQLSYQIKVKIKIQDNSTERNYYRLISQVLPNDNNSRDGNTRITLEGVLSDDQNNSSDVISTSGSYNLYNIFSDELFNGKDFNITCTINGSNQFSLKNTETQYLYVNLQNINDDYYKYLYTKSMQYSSDGVFGEPVQIYNNVAGGIGILGAYNNGNTFLKINISDLIKRAQISNSNTNYYGGY